MILLEEVGLPMEEGLYLAYTTPYGIGRPNHHDYELLRWTGSEWHSQHGVAKSYSVVHAFAGPLPEGDNLPFVPKPKRAKKQ